MGTATIDMFTGPLDEVDITSLDRYVELGYPWAEWARLRRDAPVYRYEREGYPPFWAVTRYDDVMTVQNNPEVFINGGPILRIDSTHRLDRLEAFRQRQAERYDWDVDEPFDMVFLDRPRHLDFRMITMRGFTPGAMRRLEDELHELAARHVDRFFEQLRERGELDLVAELSVGVPLATIGGMLGLPPDDWKSIHRWTDFLIDSEAGLENAQPGETLSDCRRRLGREYYEYLQNLIDERRITGPDGDDLATKVVHATVDDEPLTEQQIHGYLNLLIGAGNETTRNAITGGVTALLEHPDQLAVLAEDPVGRVETAVEEIMRWTSPVIQFARTATQDFELNGQLISAGDTVVVWYPSANRDESAWERPGEFDVRREPNFHLAFGQGHHFCLGANLARWEMRAVFAELAPRLHHVEVAGEPDRLRHLHVGGIRALPVRWVD